MRAMATDQQMDAASMAAMEQFLHEFKSPAGIIEVQPIEGRESISPSSCSTNCDDSPRGPVLVSDSESAAQRHQIRTAQAAKRQLRYLTKVRNERETLRRQKVELSTVLTKLRNAKVRANTEAANNFAFGAWRATAIRQKERRVEAEEEQRRLKALVVGQSQVIRNMNELLQQHLVQSPTAGLVSTTQGPLFHTSVRELDALHAMTNEVTAGVAFKLSTLPMEFDLNRDWNHDKTFLESRDATVIPFGFDETCRALSLALLGNSTGKDGINATATYRCHLDFSQELGESATLIVHTAVRRYIEADRVVFVMRALAEGQGEFQDLYTNESAWYVLRREGSAMVLETYTRLMPVGFDLTSDADVRGNDFVKVLVKADEEDIDDIMQVFEKMLIDEDQAICL